MWKITIDPEKPTRLWAGIQCYSTLWALPDYDGDGVTISEDGGDTWTLAPTFPFTAYGAQQALFDPADSQNVFVTTFGGGVFKANVPHVSAPAAEFAATPSGALGFAFDSSASTGTINTYIWDFGDGATSLAANPSHAYVAAGTYTVALTVQGSFGAATVSHDVTTAGVLEITTTTLPTGNLGSAYSEILAASGGTAPYTWSITSGSLPGGLGLNASTGEISGTCGASGTFNFTVQVQDSATTPATDTQALEIVVAAERADHHYRVHPGWRGRVGVCRASCGHSAGLRLTDGT